MKIPNIAAWFGAVPEITPAELHDWLANGRRPQVLDARSRLEYAQGTLGQARHAPVTAMPDAVASLTLDPHRPVVMLCLSGHRSRPGTRWLRRHGYEAYSLKGGVMAWRLAGFELEPPVGEP